MQAVYWTILVAILYSMMTYEAQTDDIWNLRKTSSLVIICDAKKPLLEDSVL